MFSPSDAQLTTTEAIRASSTGADTRVLPPPPEPYRNTPWGGIPTQQPALEVLPSAGVWESRTGAPHGLLQPAPTGGLPSGGPGHSRCRECGAGPQLQGWRRQLCVSGCRCPGREQRGLIYTRVGSGPGGLLRGSDIQAAEWAGKPAFQVGGRRAGEEVPGLPRAERGRRGEVGLEARGAGHGGARVLG